MNKLKGLIIYVLAFFVIFASFKIPEILFNIKTSNIEMAIYEKEKFKNAIDVEAEKIYLVKAIHDIESEESIIQISSSEVTGKYIFVEGQGETAEGLNKAYKELLKLQEYSIVKGVEENDKYNCVYGIAYRTYRKGNKEYWVNGTWINYEDKKYDFGVEVKTGKILDITISKDILNNQISKEELMKNYVKYLDLYIIDDWRFENNILKSEKAKLYVSLLESEEKYILGIRTLTDNLIK